MADKPKAHIDELFQVIMHYNSRMIHLTMNHVDEFEALQKELHEKLDEMGLAEHIDFSRDEC